jgi:flagellar hook assembly protein FlgD
MLTVENHDKNTTEQYQITQYFEPSANDYRSGEIFYVIDLEEGNSTIEVSASDNLDNVSISSVDVVVQGSPTLTDVMNCPNPITGTDDETYFTFVCGTPIELLKIQIFTVSGRKIKEMERYNLNAGYNQVRWDLRDNNGKRIANGVYLYRIYGKFAGDTVEEFQKLVIMR